MAAVIAEVERQAERQAQYFDPLSLSTSAFSNVVAACRYRAAQGLLGDGYDGVAYLRHRAERLEQHVAAYQRLQAEVIRRILGEQPHQALQARPADEHPRMEDSL